MSACSAYSLSLAALKIIILIPLFNLDFSRSTFLNICSVKVLFSEMFNSFKDEGSYVQII